MSLGTQPPSAVTALKTPIQRTWWKESSVYQVYPSSFKDSNGDGLGDIPGITSELDYIKSLGVDIVWLSPILQSPQVDMGYDISDYRNIYPAYGTMEDHDNMIKGMHERGLKYVMDLVVNHTSDQHEWFKQSRSSKTNPYRDWYMWRPPKYDKAGNRQPPNNWGAFFGGSTWEWDEPTQEYYLHLFAVEQPDLNWENPKVVTAVHEIIRFWLDRGVDGFRMDVINFISKDPALPDAPEVGPGPYYSGVDYFACGPRLHEFLHGIGSIMSEYDAFSVGEMPGVFDTREILKAVGQDRGELQMIFHFEIVSMDVGPGDKFSPRSWDLFTLKNIVHKWQTFMLDNSGWIALYMENHDQGRAISRFIFPSGVPPTPAQRVLASKLMATHLCLQAGTPFVYQGQELAQVNVSTDWPISKYRDLETLNHWEMVLRKYPNDTDHQKEVRHQYWLKGRDNSRTPMQWTGEKENVNAGFCPKDVEPWISVHEDYADGWNAASQKSDRQSAFTYWRDILQLRKEHKDIFVYGDFKMVDFAHEDILAYLRGGDGERGQAGLVITNFHDKEVEWMVPELEAKRFKDAKVVLQSYDDECQVMREMAGKDLNRMMIKMRPYESVVLLA